MAKKKDKFATVQLKVTTDSEVPWSQIQGAIEATNISLGRNGFHGQLFEDECGRTWFCFCDSDLENLKINNNLQEPVKIEELVVYKTPKMTLWQRIKYVFTG